MDKGKISGSLSETTKLLIIGALSFSASFAWRDFSRQFFDEAYGKRNTLTALFVYAIVVTILAVCIVYTMSKISRGKILVR